MSTTVKASPLVSKAFLGMDGADAVEFFAAYEKRFGVDISDLNPSSTLIDPEACWRHIE
jgi:acyl carrier protein